MSEEGAKEKILYVAEAEARKYRHAAITFNHLLAALIQTSPQEIRPILGPRIKSSTLLALLDRDMRDTNRHPQNLVPDGQIELGKEADKALKRTWVAVEKQNTGNWQYAAELLNTMLLASGLTALFHNGMGKDERSTALDYVRMVLSPPPTEGIGTTAIKTPPNNGGVNNFGWQAPYIALGMF